MRFNLSIRESSQSMDSVNPNHPVKIVFCDWAVRMLPKMLAGAGQPSCQCKNLQDRRVLLLQPDSSKLSQLIRETEHSLWRIEHHLAQNHTRCGAETTYGFSTKHPLQEIKLWALVVRNLLGVGPPSCLEGERGIREVLMQPLRQLPFQH